MSFKNTHFVQFILILSTSLSKKAYFLYYLKERNRIPKKILEEINNTAYCLLYVLFLD